jgi:hypothetical protein
MTILTEPTNSDRAAWAEEALIAFCRLTGSNHEDALGDLLCDLMHWADENHLNFDAMLTRAHEHHVFEVLEAGEVQP